ncbi:hypothetical protein FH972_026232 [Carpinus fangiana]|uniref:MFS general substrate transporter n=1 Tax=Carpinus fangiana TaxID=176857 RepID=A0A5N6L5Z7_9ROSI|nr:hypothetical protein FH972_026232 [Carpinus fangiana]
MVAKKDTAQDASEKASPPPSYAENGQHEEQTLSGLKELNISLNPKELAASDSKLHSDHVIAHLKLLHAIQDLRNDISNQEGLWGLSDSFLPAPEAPGIPVTPAAQKIEVVRKRIQEKRWAVFVSRASERFNRWWAALQSTHSTAPLKMQDFNRDNPQLIDRGIPSSSVGECLSKAQLPPLDVLMVWHAFMLNPRCYLEDCLRGGMMQFWHRGMPWAAVDAAIDESGYYDPGPEAQSEFCKMTASSAWTNTSSTVDMKFGWCPSCEISRMASLSSYLDGNNIVGDATESVPWTTVDVLLQNDHDELKELAAGTDFELNRLLKRIDSFMSLATGYADPAFEARCSRCKDRIDHDALRARKFARDASRFYRPYDNASHLNYEPSRVDNVPPMPGTILAMDGRPQLADTVTGLARDTRLFPNRVCDAMINTPHIHGSALPTFNFKMHEMKRMVELTLRDYPSLAYCQERIYIRKMFSRYWDNSSPFALDLVGAVIRQGSFIEKMVNIDWLHSPTVAATASRVIQKYTRFMAILAANPAKMAVPTLDVDLAWHTHQLSPSAYYKYSIDKTKGTFIDHDDKVAETTLSDAFERTSEQYQRLFGEPYSECTCWYCESIRASHTSSASRLLRRSSVSQITQQLHGAPSDPDRAAHISAHNAIRPMMDHLGGYETIAAAHMAKMRSAFDKACKRARKDGRPEPKMPPWFTTNAKDRKGGSARTSQTDPYYPYAYGYPMYYGVPYYGGCGTVPYGCDPGVNSASYAADPACASAAAGSYGACCQDALLSVHSPSLSTYVQQRSDHRHRGETHYRYRDYMLRGRSAHVTLDILGAVDAVMLYHWGTQDSNVVPQSVPTPYHNYICGDRYSVLNAWPAERCFPSGPCYLSLPHSLTQLSSSGSSLTAAHSLPLLCYHSWEVYTQTSSTESFTRRRSSVGMARGSSLSPAAPGVEGTGVKPDDQQPLLERRPRKLSYNPVGEWVPEVAKEDPIGAYEVPKARRVGQVFVASIYCLLAAGIVFGYAALKPVLISEGVYRDKCTKKELSDNIEVCYEQELRLNFMFTFAAVATNVSALPVGAILDRFGPRVSGIIGAVFVAIGCLFLGFAAQVSFDSYLPGYFFLALGGPFVFISSFQLSNTFPRYSGLILALLTGAFDTSSAIFLFYRLTYTATDEKFVPKRFFLVYLVVPVFILLVQLFLMPAASYKTVGELISVAESQATADDNAAAATATTPEEAERLRVANRERRESVISEITSLVGGTTASHTLADAATSSEENTQKKSGVAGALHGLTAWQQIRSPWWLLITMFTALQMTRINYFVATVRPQYEFLLGTHEQAVHVNNVFDVLLPLGGVISVPFIGLILDNSSTVSVLGLLVGLATAIGALGIVKGSLWAAYANIALFVVYRPLYYTTVSDYAAKVFGFDTFGRVYGLIICVAGLFNFAQSGLDALTIKTFHRDPRPVNIILLCAALAVGAALVIFVGVRARSIRREMLEREAVSSEERERLMPGGEEVEDRHPIDVHAHERSYGTNSN